MERKPRRGFVENAFAQRHAFAQRIAPEPKRLDATTTAMSKNFAPGDDRRAAHNGTRSKRRRHGAAAAMRGQRRLPSGHLVPRVPQRSRTRFDEAVAQIPTWGICRAQRIAIGIVRSVTSPRWRRREIRTRVSIRSSSVRKTRACSARDSGRRGCAPDRGSVRAGDRRTRSHDLPSCP